VDRAHVKGANLADQVVERRGRQGAGLGEHEHLLAEDHQRRDRHDPDGRREAALGFGVHLGEHQIVVTARGVLEDWREHPARAAPRRPPVDEDDVVARDRLLEGCLGQFDGGHGALLVTGGT